MLPQHPPCWILSHLGSAGQENSCGESGPGRPPPTPAAAPLPAAALPRPDGGGPGGGAVRGGALQARGRPAGFPFAFVSEGSGGDARRPSPERSRRPGPARRPPPSSAPAAGGGRREPLQARLRPRPRPGRARAPHPPRPSLRRRGPLGPFGTAPVRRLSSPPGPSEGRVGSFPPPAPPPPPAGPGAGAARPVPPAAGCRRAPLSGGAVLPGRPRGLRRRASSESPGEERGEPGIPSACFLLQIIYIFFLRVCAFYTLLLVAVKVMCKQVLVFPQMCW